MNNLGQVYQLERPHEKSIIVAGDFHSRHLHLPTFKAMIKYSKALDDPWIILNGDVLDFAFFMPKNDGYKKWIKREDGIDEFFLPEFKSECSVVAKMLDVLQRHFSRVVWISGNHDTPRVAKFLPNCPFEYRPHFDIKKELELEKRGIPLLEYGDWLDITPALTITHSNWHNATCLKKNFEACGKNVIISHVHRHEVKAFITRGVTKYATSLPSMAYLNPEYMRNSENNWANGFGELNLYGNEYSLYTHLWKGKSMILPRGIRITDD